MALQRIEYLAANPDASNEESPYYSVDPAPALPISTPTDQLKLQLLDESQRMFDVSRRLGARTCVGWSGAQVLGLLAPPPQTPGPCRRCGDAAVCAAVRGAVCSAQQGRQGGGGGLWGAV